MKNEIISKIVRLSESINKGKVQKIDLLRGLTLIKQNPDINLDIYEGYIISYYFYKFRKCPSIDMSHDFVSNKIFLKCDDIYNKSILSSGEIKKLFLEIISMPDDQQKKRNMLLGSFYCCLWPLMNNPKNIKMATNYGLAIIKSAFSLDSFNYLNKIKLTGKNIKIINLAGSGKKEIKLLNISSMSSIITAAISKKINENIIVEKTVSRATSSVSGSSDIFEALGVNLNIPIRKMAKISLKTGLGIFDINNTVPKLNYIYDGKLYNVQVFAGLVGGAAIVNPIDSNLINYGLTRGSNKLCLSILSRLYPKNNILIVSGKNSGGKSIMDQVSIMANTEIIQKINGKNSLRTITPKMFGFNFKSFKYVQTARNSNENIKQFIRFLIGRGDKDLNRAVAMEVALNLYGLGISNNLRICANLALKTIHSGAGIKIIKNLIYYSGGDVSKFNDLLRSV